ncbi:MAG: radical SAM protein [Deltaproteobacteria bacterium]|nr:radical SAM protein [Deltaproteobacteria bacterium]
MIYNIAIDITNHCNFDCVHCLRDKVAPRAHMSPELLDLVLREMSSVGIMNVCLTGGEPALHPQLNSVCDLLVDYGVRFSLVSNGFLFEDKILPLFDARLRNHLAGVCFSLDGATSASHDMIRKEGSFDRVISSIEACVKEKIPVSVKSIVHKENREEIVEVAHLCASIGVGSLGYVLLTPTPLLVSKNLIPTAEEYTEIIRYITGRIMPSFSLNISIEGFAHPDYRVPFCNPAHGISFDHLGNFIFCCNLSHPTNGDNPNVFGKEYLGNIGEIGIEEGILRHYRTLAWFMDKIMRLDVKKDWPVNCTKCFRLFGKMKWMEADESADNRYR